MQLVCADRSAALKEYNPLNTFIYATETARRKKKHRRRITRGIFGWQETNTTGNRTGFSRLVFSDTVISILHYRSLFTTFHTSGQQFRTMRKTYQPRDI